MTLSPAALYASADMSGRAAANALVCRPMVVTNTSGSQQWLVEDGVCGFAWVKIRPATGPFVKFLKDNQIGRKDSYAGGYMVSIFDYNQSMQKKEAYAYAFADVLNANGVNAVASSRMD